MRGVFASLASLKRGAYPGLSVGPWAGLAIVTRRLTGVRIRLRHSGLLRLNIPERTGPVGVGESKYA